MKRLEAVRIIESALLKQDHETTNSMDYQELASYILTKLEDVGLKPPIIQEDVIIDPLLGPIRLSARRWEDES